MNTLCCSSPKETEEIEAQAMLLAMGKGVCFFSLRCYGCFIMPRGFCTATWKCLARSAPTFGFFLWSIKEENLPRLAQTTLFGWWSRADIRHSTALLSRQHIGDRVSVRIILIYLPVQQKNVRVFVVSVGLATNKWSTFIVINLKWLFFKCTGPAFRRERIHWELFHC